MLGSLGSGLTGKVAAARLLYAMGRDEVLPRRPFGYLDPVRNNPTYNILLIGVCTLAGALCLDLEHAGELLNFGAFLSFIGVNLAALRQSYMHRHTAGRAQIIREMGISALGLLFSLGMWLSLPVLAKVVGGAWFWRGSPTAAGAHVAFASPLDRSISQVSEFHPRIIRPTGQ